MNKFVAAEELEAILEKNKRELEEIKKELVLKSNITDVCTIFDTKASTFFF